MNVYYTGNGCFMTPDELYHYGVKGMKWGCRKATSVANVGRTRRQDSQTDRNSPEAKVTRKAKAAKAAKIGAAVVGTALAVYGTYKLAKYVQGKRSQAAMQKASDYLNNNLFKKVGDTTFRDGTRQFDYADGIGNKIVTRGSRSNIGKYVGQQNAKTVATARQMYKDATNTKLDKGLARVVSTGDAIGNAAKRTATSAANTARSSANKAKNAILDAVNPIYEYTPGATTSKTRDYGNGIKYTEAVTNYVKTKRRRR